MSIFSADSAETFKVSVFRCQYYEPDDVENDQIPQSVICLLTPDTRNLLIPDT
jgi:hypothetical protein